jgi:hypothetical protein
MNHPSQNGAARLEPLEAEVLAAFTAHGSMTDQALEQVTGKSIRSVSPRRRKLADKGYLEEVGKAKTAPGKQATVWGVVPEERVEEVREKNKNRQPRKKDIRKLPLDKKLEIIRQLLDDPAVNGAAKGQHGRAWSKVRGRVHDRRGQRERERPELNAQIREAERKDSPIVEFLKLKRLVKDATETVRAVDRFVAEDLERRDANWGKHISVPQWPEVVDSLTDLAAITDSTLASIREVMGVLGDDVIEGEAIDVEEIFELPEGGRR